MTDETPTSKRPRNRQDEVIEDAVVVDETAAAEPAPVTNVADADVAATTGGIPDGPVVSPAEPAASPSEPVASPTEPEASPAEPVATTSPTVAYPAATAPAEPAPRIVYVEAPVPPKQLGNRGVGVLFALLGTVIFGAALALATFIIQLATTGLTRVNFLTSLEFYIPIAVFLVAFVVLVLLANRAAWWAYILGSLIVGLVVYFGTAGLGLLASGVIQDTATEAAQRWNASLVMPFVIIAAVLAREVAMWMGVAIARRGRKVKARNIQRRADWQRELDEKRAERERAVYAASPAE